VNQEQPTDSDSWELSDRTKDRRGTLGAKGRVALTREIEGDGTFYRSLYDSCVVTSSQEAKGGKSIYTRKSLHQVLFSHPQSLVSSVLSTDTYTSN
jgi:hypothetical protein